MGIEFQSIATRLVKEQSRLKTLLIRNCLGGSTGWSNGFLMFTVCLRVFEQDGGKLKKVNGGDINTAFAKTQRAFKESLLPLDDNFSERAKGIEWRAQPNLLDEILWALFDRSEEDKKEEEAPLDTKQSALIYLMLWTTVGLLIQNIAPEKKSKFGKVYTPVGNMLIYIRYNSFCFGGLLMVFFAGSCVFLAFIFPVDVFVFHALRYISLILLWALMPLEREKTAWLTILFAQFLFGMSVYGVRSQNVDLHCRVWDILV